MLFRKGHGTRFNSSMSCLDEQAAAPALDLYLELAVMASSKARRKCRGTLHARVERGA